MRTMLLDYDESFACQETIFDSLRRELRRLRHPFGHELEAGDHVERATYALCLADASQGREGRRWVRDTRRRLDSLPAAREPSAHPALRIGAGG